MNIFQKLMVKPWLTTSAVIDDRDGGGKSYQVTEKVGLTLFMTVISMLFSLFAIAYYMRMKLGDWQALPDPEILWPNTAVLVLSSLAMQWAVSKARRGQMDGLRLAFLVGGVFALAFLAGQYMAWQQLAALGYYAQTNPANAFFYVITGVHGVHLAGGLIAWTRTAGKLWSGLEASEVRLGVELCAIYWHFLLLVWIVMFALLLFT